MIIVWGSIEAQAGKLEQALQLCLEHVHRSRCEPGCISHSVQIDAENPNRLVFFEEWRDMPTLQAHFNVPESRLFIKSTSKLATGTPQMKIFEANKID